MASVASLPPGIDAEVQAAIARTTGSGSRIVSVRPLGGGCVNHASVVATEIGDRFFVKWNQRLPGIVFGREAEGLDALRRTRSVRVPEVVGVSTSDSPEGWILMEYVERGRPGRSYWIALGRQLAALHTPSDEPFGWPSDNFIASLSQANRPTVDWGRFWTDYRVRPQLEIAAEQGLIDPTSSPWPALCDALPEVVHARGSSRASLLHGDLWSGNVYPDERGDPVLVDPAVYRGDGEVDLAMADLFGGFSDEFFQSYREARGGGNDPVLRAAYQLYPLLVHVNLFGSGYLSGALRAAEHVLFE